MLSSLPEFTKTPFLQCTESTTRAGYTVSTAIHCQPMNWTQLQANLSLMLLSALVANFVSFSYNLLIKIITIAFEWVQSKFSLATLELAEPRSSNVTAHAQSNKH